MGRVREAVKKPPPLTRREVRRGHDQCRARRIQVWDYNAADNWPHGDYYGKGVRRGNTKRRLCPPCHDDHNRKTPIPKNSKIGVCVGCAVSRS